MQDSSTMVTLAGESFANEVKADRLKILNQLTIVAAVGILSTTLFCGTSFISDLDFDLILFVPFVVMLTTCLISLQLLRQEQRVNATWFYAIGMGVAASTGLYYGDEISLELVPFIFPVIVFIVGLLMSPISTFIMTGLAAGAIILVPLVSPFVTIPTVLIVHQVFAIVLMFVAAVLAAQVTGELYQITEWSLENYRRQSRTNTELFDKRQQLQKTLRRSEALADKLQESNVELEIAHQEAEEARQFRGQFLANMSHELRTPLNAIIGFSETMLQFPVMYDDESLPDPYERDMSQIYNSGRQLLHVINDILDLARVDAGKLEIHMQRVEITPIVNAVMSTAKGLLGQKDVKLQADVPDPMPDVWADESRLRQVLLNLYSNACKYTTEGVIKIRIRPVDDMIEFSVQDTGSGIAEEYHEKLFEEFQQAGESGRDPRSGAGLGLAITKQLLDLMQGDLWFESTRGEGSTFYFTVHAYREQDKQPLPEPQMESSDKPESSDTTAPDDGKKQTPESLIVSTSTPVKES